MTPDGKIFAAALVKNIIQLWNVDTGKKLRQLNGPQSGIADLLFSPDGKTIAVVGNDRSIHILKTENGDEIRQIKANQPKGPIRLVAGAGGFTESSGLAFSRDGKLLASVEIEFAQQKTAIHLKITDLENGNEIRKTEIAGGISSIAFSPDGKILVHTSGPNIVLREADTGKEIRTLKTGAGGVATIAFSPDSKTIAARGNDQVVRHWDAGTGKLLHEFGEPVFQPGRGVNFFIAGVNAGSEVRDLAFSRDDKTIGVGSGQTPRFFNVSTGKEQPLAGGHRSGVSTLAISPDGKTMISRGADNIVRRWNAQTGEELGQFPEPVGTVGVAISPDGKMIAFAKADNTVRVHAVETGKELHKAKGHRNGVAVLAFSADSKILASRGSNDNTIHLFDLAKGGDSRAIAVPSEAQANPGVVFFAPAGTSVSQGLAFSPDGAFIATNAGDNAGPASMIRIFDVVSGKEIRQFKMPPQRSVHGLAYSPDGRLLAVDNGDGTVSLWEIASANVRAVLGDPRGAKPSPQDLLIVRAHERAGFGSAGITAHPSPSIAFSSDGQLLAARGPGHSIRVWEVAFAKEAGRFTGHTAEAAALAFAPDGKTVASGSADTTILVWDAKRLKREPSDAVALTAEQVKSLWADLAGSDAVKAGQSVRLLAAGAKEAMPFLNDQFKPAVPIDPKKIAQWITDLDSGNFPKRNQAAAELEKIGALARPALKKILDSNPSPETRRRVEPLMEKLITGTLNAEQQRQARAIEALERSGSPEGAGCSNIWRRERREPCRRAKPRPP